MFSEINSKLISALYSSDDDEEIARIADDMSEIGDAGVLRPIIDVYKRKIESSYSHYLVSALGDIKSSEVPIWAWPPRLSMRGFYFT